LFGAVLFGVRSAPAALSAIAVGALVTGVWQWGLDAPFGLDDGLIPGVLANLVVYTVVAAATANRYPRRRQPALASQGVSA
jgi:SSS family solute:Na+ symporter